jgi:hypothetical protein
MINKDKKKIENNVEKSKAFPKFFEFNGRIYFRNSYDVLVSLPSQYFLERLDSLKEYFIDREEPQRKKLIRENLSIFASPLEDKIYNPKLEVVYQSNAVTCVKYSGYSPKEDYQPINERVIKSLRGERLEDSKESENHFWNSAYERTRWVTDYALKVRNKLRKELVGD